VTQVLRKRSYRPTACYVELDSYRADDGDFRGVEFPTVDEAKAARRVENAAQQPICRGGVDRRSGEGAAPTAGSRQKWRVCEVKLEALKAQMKPQGAGHRDGKTVEELPVLPEPQPADRASDGDAAAFDKRAGDVEDAAGIESVRERIRAFAEVSRKNPR